MQICTVKENKGNYQLVKFQDQKGLPRTLRIMVSSSELSDNDTGTASPPVAESIVEVRRTKKCRMRDHVNRIQCISAIA